MTFLIFQSGEDALSKHLLAIQYSVSVMNSPFTFESWFHGDYPRQMTSLDSKSEVIITYLVYLFPCYLLELDPLLE